jgi:lysozyme family protein
MAAKDIIQKMITTWEGGFVNNPADKGGATKYGITIGTLGKYLGRAATVDEVRNLSMETAISIYERYYFNEYKIDKMPDGIQDLILDLYVQHRPLAAGRIIQRGLNRLGAKVAEDGIVGNITLAKISHECINDNLSALRKAIVAERLDFYDKLIVNDPSQRVFEKGWKRRANSFI